MKNLNDRSRKPLIGVTPLYDEEKESYWMLPGYFQALEHAGAIPVMLPLTDNEPIITQLVSQFDGFLFTGGHDVSPELYGEDVTEFCGPICVERDRMEQLLFRKILDLDKPLFGICRAIQFINVFLGGTLYQDIPHQMQADVHVDHRQLPPYNQPSHKVKIHPGTPLAELFASDHILVNSYHHQGICKLASDLMCAATAPDGLVEAVFMEEKTCVLAVQWHPEFSWNSNPQSAAIFSWFVRQCQTI